MNDPRLQERKQPERRVFCKLDGDESGSVLNLSEDGLCFESLTPIEEKGLLHLRLSVGLNSPIEATGQLAWLDSAKRTGGLRFLELSAPAREQIRAWLSENSTASRGTKVTTSQKRDKQADDGAAIEKLPTWQATRLQSTQLVPIERHRAQARWLFLLGVLLGSAICTAVIIAISQYAGGTILVSPVQTTASPNRPAQSGNAQSSAAQTQPSVTQPASPSTSASEPAALQTVPVAAPISSPQRQSPPTAVAPVPAASKAHSSSGQLQHSTKLPVTPQQLWSSFQAGDMKAAVALADLYTRGEGVPVNCEQARILLLVASKRKSAEASKKLDELDNGGCPAKSE